jgi:hypothetical protein
LLAAITGPARPKHFRAERTIGSLSPNICIYLYIYIYIYISKQNLEGPEAEDAAIHICIYIHSLTV